MLLLNYLLRRERKGISNGYYNWDMLLSNFGIDKSHSYSQSIDDDSPPLGLGSNDTYLVVTTEKGSVIIFRKNDLKLVVHWQGHSNAVFDVKWRPSAQQVLTAAGDQCILLWDIESHRPVFSVERAHRSSIKSLSFKDCNIFASGARDGAIKIWDIRLSEPEVACIKDAHLSNFSHKKTRSASTTRSSPLSSVTCVLYAKENCFLYSSGANDAKIKLWDERKILSNAPSQKPFWCLPYAGSKGSNSLPSHGFTSLTQDSSGYLYASCSDHSVYRYAPYSDFQPYRYAGHQVNNFTKIKLLADRYLVSGSTTGKAFIWSLNRLAEESLCQLPIFQLAHGLDEVPVVETDDSNWSVYTCSDDCHVLHWNVNATLDEKCSISKAEKYTRKDVEVLDVIPKKRKCQSVGPTPIHSLDNWLSPVPGVSDSENTPLEPSTKTRRKSDSETPVKCVLGENTQSNRQTSKEYSKKILFSSNQSTDCKNRKITEFFKQGIVNSVL